jgi:hypothetical protein
MIYKEGNNMNRLCAYIIISLLFLFFLIATAFSKICQYYYRCKDELFPIPSPKQHLSTSDDSADIYDSYPAEKNISVPFLAEL